MPTFEPPCDGSVIVVGLTTIAGGCAHRDSRCSIHAAVTAPMAAHPTAIRILRE